MTIEAMKQLIELYDKHCYNNDYGGIEFNKKHGYKFIEAIEALRTAIQQAESEPVGEPRARVELAKTGGNVGLATRIIELDIATLERLLPGDLLYTHPAPGVPEFSRIAKRKLDELQEQGFAITGYAIQRGPVRGFIDGGGFVGWWQGEPDPGVPDGWKLVPIEPTAEMLQAALKVATPGALRAAWARMLAASPAQKGGE